MTPSEIIAFLSEKNIIVSVDGEQLKVTAAKDTMTPEMSALIRKNKAELIEYLSKPNHTKPEPDIIGRRYSLQDGTMLTVSDEDFDNMVEVFRMLAIMKSRQY